MNSPHSLRLALQLERPAFRLRLDVQLPGTGITVVFGQSGSGKTSLLRCVAGLDRPDQAHIAVHGQVWQDDKQGVFLAPWQRPVGYVFQEASLFPHLDVRANLHYGLRRAKDADPAALHEAIALLGIGNLLARDVAALSGGERQRVAIAAALALRPGLLLLDEPLAALDAPRRQEIMPWLERLRDQVRIPMLYVTHSVDEVARLADHLLVLSQGQVQASGPVSQVLAGLQPPIALGEDMAAIFSATVQARDPRWQLMQVQFGDASLWIKDGGQPLGTAVRLRLWARDISLARSRASDTSIQNLLPATVAALLPDAHPSQVLVQLQCGGQGLWARITARAAQALELQVGSAVWAQIKSAALVG